MAQILVIEDMKTVRRTVCAMLTRAGHDVAEALDGRDGLDILQAGQRFDVVITDVLMPDKDGSEVPLHLSSELLATIDHLLQTAQPAA